MIGLLISTILWIALGMGIFFGICFIAMLLTEWFEGRSKVKRYAQQRQREMLHERWVQSDSAMRMVDDLRRQFRDRP